MLGGQTIDQRGNAFKISVFFGNMQHGLFALGKDVPGKGSTGVFPFAFCKPFISGDDGVFRPLGVIVGACVAGGEIVLLVDDEEGFDEIGDFSG